MALPNDSQSATSLGGDRTQRIVLTGFMGSGKSTVGPLLAERLSWEFVDVDDVIVAETGMPIAEFFARHGEPAFRARERETIARLASEPALVLALGGGAIEDEATRELLLHGAGTKLVHLEVTLETTRARCAGTEGVRPVLADEAHLKARYDRRMPLYRTAHLTVATDARTPEEIVKEILESDCAPTFAGFRGLTRAALHDRKLLREMD